MLFFHTSGHGWFLLGLCLLGPALGACLTGSFGGVAYRRSLARAEHAPSGVAIARHAAAPQLAAQRPAVTDDDHAPAPRHADIAR